MSDSFVTMPSSNLRRMAEACRDEIRAEKRALFEEAMAEVLANDERKAKSWWRFWFSPRTREQVAEYLQRDWEHVWNYRIHRCYELEAANELLSGLTLTDKHEVQVSIKTLGLISCSSSRSLNFEPQPYRT